MNITMTRMKDKPFLTIDTKLDKITMQIIDKTTSYKIKGAEHIDNQSYLCPKCGWWILKNHANSDYCKRCGTQCDSALWDCIIRLLAKTRGGVYYFPAGLLESVENVLKSIGHVVHVIGWPSEPQNGQEKLDLTWRGWELRSHQLEAMEKARIRLKSGRGCVLEMATGSGKTVTALKLIQELEVNTLILVHKKNLMEQWYTAIRENIGWTPNIFGDNQKEIGPITIGMVQSIANNKDFPLYMFDFVIADEAHHISCDQTYGILTKSNAYYKLGLSATPKREDGNEMKIWAACGDIIKVSSIKELIKRGILARPTIELINAPMAQQGNTYAESYKNQVTMNTPRNQLITNKANKLSTEKGLSVLITVNQIRHGKTLEAMIKGSKFIHGTTKKEERLKAMKDFGKGELKVMISTLLNEGSDIPSLDVIILAAGGKSETAQIQKVGRALRTTNTKKTAMIIDIMDGGKWLRDHAQNRAKMYTEVFGGV